MRPGLVILDYDQNEILRAEELYKHEEISQPVSTSEASRAEPQIEPELDVTEPGVLHLASWLNDVEVAQLNTPPKEHSLTYVQSKPELPKALPLAKDTAMPRRIEVLDSADRERQGEIKSAEYAVPEEVSFERNVAQLDILLPNSETPNNLTNETTQSEEVVADIKTSFETVNQELVSELLIDLISADPISPNNDGINIYTAGIEVNSESSEESHLDDTNLIDRFTEYLEQYEPEVQERATELINLISEVVNELKLKDNLSDDVKEQLVAKLEQTICELFSGFGIKLKPEQSHKFVELLTATLNKDQYAVRLFDIDYLNKMGTSEYRLSSRIAAGSALANWVNDELSSIKLVGRYIIKVCLT